MTKITQITQPRLDRERISKVQKIQNISPERMSDNDHLYIRETNSLIQDLFDVTNEWKMAGCTYIDEAFVYDEHLHVLVVWGDGDTGSCSFPVSILDSDDPVKAARVDFLKKKINNNIQAIEASNRTIKSCQQNIIDHQKELFDLTGSATGDING